MGGRDEFLAARDFLLAHRHDYETAYRDFHWPRPTHFNWARDYFDSLGNGNEQPALVVVDEVGGSRSLSFKDMARRSSQVANYLLRVGVGCGDRLLLMLDNVPELWESLLAAMKIGAVVVPTTTLMNVEGLRQRLAVGQVRHVLAESELAARFDAAGVQVNGIAVGEAVSGWHRYSDSEALSEQLKAQEPTRGDDLFLLYFTSGTTATPKLVAHSHLTYPVGHLSTMYWIGLGPDDRHCNISSPGWAKHAWSSFFAPWNAGATVIAFNGGRFDPSKTLHRLVEHEITTLCAPPTVWRLLIQQDLSRFSVKLREVVSAGEPLNPEVIDRVKRAWGITIRDGYGQTETSAQIANPPGVPVKPGAMGRPLPGFVPVLLGPDGKRSNEGELALSLRPRPVGLMQGYQDDLERTRQVMADDVYRTGDVARCDKDGLYWYVGRADDVFKSADYRISPFEIESALIEYQAIAEAAVVPSPDPIRYTVPKAYVTLRSGYTPDRATAADIFEFGRRRLQPYQRIRKLEFMELPKTISGKIRRVELRKHAGTASEAEYREEELKST